MLKGKKKEEKETERKSRGIKIRRRYKGEEEDIE
jgi:hypothetical protein